MARDSEESLIVALCNIYTTALAFEIFLTKYVTALTLEIQNKKRFGTDF